MTPTPKNSTNFTAIDRLTADGTAQNIEGLALLFPEVITETLDENGRPTKAVNFEALQQLLSDHLVDPGKERYELTWPGKQQARFTAHQPIAKTLRPNRSESVDFDTTQNLFIEGDNLDALKILRNSYVGKVKLVYIDPPYNTGNDFVYKDDFGSTRSDYLISAEESDEEGNRLVSNTTSNGRFHSDWLSMMYTRIKIAKELLTEDGLIFISIDQNEFINCKKLLLELFSEANYVAEFIWKKKKGGGNDSKYIAVEHEYILVACKNKSRLPYFSVPMPDDYAKRYSEKDEQGRFFWDTFKRKSGKQYYPITAPDGTVLEKDEFGNPISWLRSERTFKKNLQDGEVRFFKNVDNWSVHFKQRMPSGMKPRSILEKSGTTSDGSKEVLGLFSKNVFDNPKPINLIKKLLTIQNDKSSIILDFFAGSSTTAHATILQNSIDGGSRRFIMVQLPEELKQPETLDNGTVVTTIADLSRERIRRAAAQIRESAGLTADSLDLGFRALTVDDTNFANNFAAADVLTQDDLLGQLSSVKTGRTGEDLLFQTLLSLGLPLDVDIKTLKIAGAEVYSVAGGSLLACFEPDLNDALVTAIAEHARDYAKDELIPVDYLVLLDSAFETDASRINAGQIFNQLSPETSLRVI